MRIKKLTFFKRKLTVETENKVVLKKMKNDWYCFFFLDTYLKLLKVCGADTPRHLS